MRKLAIVTALSAAVLAGCSQEKEVALETDIDKMSYGIGLSMARSVASQPMDFNHDALVMGLKDALAEKEPKLDEATLRQAFAAVRESQMQKQEQASAEALQVGEDYLAENAKKEGVETTDSGLQYEVLASGEGASPSATDTVKVHYHGTLIDGTVFDSSVERDSPATFPVNRVISGWTEALQLMQEGDKWRLTVPADLAYGEQSPSPKIPANSVLIFEVELLEVQKES